MSKQYNTILFDTKNFTKKIVLSNVKITPDLAAELLQHNTNNRPVSNNTVKAYSKEMKEGKWEFAGDPIRFSMSGKLLDGQHRLKAAVDASHTFVVNIQSGLEEKTFEVMDIGRSRSAADAVAIMGFENHNTFSGAVKLIMAYIDKKIYPSDSRKRYSNAEVVAYINNMKAIDQELLKECATFGNRCQYRAKFFSASTYCAFLYLFSKKDKEQAFFFFELLSTGENIGRTNCSMIYLLRQKLINVQTTNTYVGTIDKFALLIKSWNHYRNNKEIAHLFWQTDKEDFPTII